MSLSSVVVPSDVLRVEHARGLTQAVQLAYETTRYTFRSSPWFVDVKDRFRIFEFNDRCYIAKRTRIDKAREEIEKSRQAFDHIEGIRVEDKTLRVVVPELVGLDEHFAYIVSEYVGSDLNQVSYEGGKPKLTAQKYVNIVIFLLKKGIAHPGFLPRNIVERDDELFLLDWEDASFSDEGSHIEFDRLWYTNFLLNWSYLFPYEKFVPLMADINGKTELIEPPLVHYEKTFATIAQLHGKSVKEIRNSIEDVVFGAELPVPAHTHDKTLRPNDLGHLIADIFFDDIDVVGDMATKVIRTHDEGLYAALNEVLSRIIQLCRDNNLVDIHYYAMVGILLLLEPSAYTADEYHTLAMHNSLAALVATVQRINSRSIAATFLGGKVDAVQLDAAIRRVVEEAIGIVLPQNPPFITRITDYVRTLQGASR